MTETQTAIRRFLGLPYHLQVRIMFDMGVWHNINNRQPEHEKLTECFQFIYTFKLKDRFIYETTLVYDELEKTKR
jgi:sulfur relay (sulfurtransferase) DsrF/TusC family protein